jgi:hypothetical protein
MMHKNFCQDGGQVLKSFRTVAKSNVELFRVQPDHVHHLLGGRHIYSSGAFFEKDCCGAFYLPFSQGQCPSISAVCDQCR